MRRSPTISASCSSSSSRRCARSRTTATRRRSTTKTFAKADPGRAPKPFYIGDDVKIEGTSLGPDGRWMLVFTTPKSYDKGKAGKLQHFVTESGYEEQEDERTRVGRNDPAPQSMLLLDLVDARSNTSSPPRDLPGIHDDPLKGDSRGKRKGRAREKRSGQEREGGRRGQEERQESREGRQAEGARGAHRLRRRRRRRRRHRSGATTAATSRSRSARSTTRIAGSRPSISARTSSSRSIA